MPKVTIHVGGRGFDVSCQDGEEIVLHAAAKLLDDEAQILSDQIGRMPESRMLLMAGLMLADKAAAQEDRVKLAEAGKAGRGKAGRGRGGTQTGAQHASARTRAHQGSGRAAFRYRYACRNGGSRRGAGGCY